MHLDESAVQGLLHGEMAAPAEAAARDHLAACAQCVDQVAAARRHEEEVASLLRQLDHAPPAIDARAIVARAHVPSAQRGRWAAGLLLAFGLAGVAYAAPGTPFRGWIAAAIETIGGGATPPPAPESVATPSAVAGIAVEPGRDLLVLFTAAQGEGSALITMTDGAEVVVRTRIGAATFTSDVGRLVIENRESTAGFEIDVPRSAARVEIRVAGRRVFLKESSRLTTTTAPDARGRYLLPLGS